MRRQTSSQGSSEQTTSSHENTSARCRRRLPRSAAAVVTSRRARPGPLSSGVAAGLESPRTRRGAGQRAVDVKCSATTRRPSADIALAAGVWEHTPAVRRRPRPVPGANVAAPSTDPTSRGVHRTAMRRPAPRLPSPPAQRARAARPAPGREESRARKLVGHVAGPACERDPGERLRGHNARAHAAGTHHRPLASTILRRRVPRPATRAER